MALSRSSFVFYYVKRDADVVVVQSNAIDLFESVGGSPDDFLYWQFLDVVDGVGASVVNGFQFDNGDAVDNGGTGVSQLRLLKSTTTSLVPNWDAAPTVFAEISQFNENGPTGANSQVPIYLVRLDSLDFLWLYGGGNGDQVAHGNLPAAATLAVTAQDLSSGADVLHQHVALTHSYAGSEHRVTFDGPADAYKAAQSPGATDAAFWSQDDLPFGVTLTTTNGADVSSAVFDGSHFEGDNGTSVSVVAPAARVTLRRLMTTGDVDIDGFVHFEQQPVGPGGAASVNASDRAVNVALPSYVSSLAAARTAGAAPAALTFDDDAALVTKELRLDRPGGVSYGTSGTYDLTVESAVSTFMARPPATYSGLDVAFRTLTPDPLTLPFANDSSGVVATFRDVEVDAAVAPEAYSFGLDTQLFTGATTLTLEVASTGPLDAVFAWAAGGVVACDAGGVTLLLTRADDARPPVKVDVAVAVEAAPVVALDIEAVVPAAGVHDLKPARRGYGYQVDVRVDLTNVMALGETIDWTLGGAPAGLQFLGGGTTATTTQSASNDARVVTLETSGTVPNGWANPVGFTLSADYSAAGGGPCSLLGQATGVALSIEVRDVTEVDVAVLLDRSGSMGGHERWEAAISGAHAFARLLKLENDDLGAAHNVGIYWFQSSGPWMSDNYDNAQAGHAGYGGFQGANDVYFPLETAGAQSVDFGDALDDGFLANIVTAGVDQQPGKATAIGAGMLYARDKLNKLHADLGDPTDRQKILLVLSDGMENRGPTVEDATDPSLTYWDNTDGVRLAAVALATSGSWATKLTNAVLNTGGSADDVKHFAIGDFDAADTAVPPDAYAALGLQTWYVQRFGDLLGLSTSETIDPWLTEGQEHETRLWVTDSHDKLTFFVATSDDAQGWSVSVTAPDGRNAMTSGDGVVFADGPRYVLVQVRYPLPAPDSHRWTGEWSITVRREAAGGGAFGLTILTNKTTEPTVLLSGPAQPHTGDTMTIKAIPGEGAASLSGSVTLSPPPVWLDDLLAKRASGREPLPDAVGTDSQAGSLHALVDELAAQPPAMERQTTTLPLAALGGGAYGTTFVVDRPGTWNIDTVVFGTRRFKLPRLRATPHLAALRANFPPHFVANELTYLRRHAGSKQRQQVRNRRTLVVDLLPSAKTSTTSGVLRRSKKATEIVLTVRPKDSAGRLLGPGRANDVQFSGRGMRFVAQDLGNGTYRAKARVVARGAVPDLRHGGFRAQRIEFYQGESVLPLLGGRFVLTSFEARVLNVRIPISVRNELRLPKRPAVLSYGAIFHDAVLHVRRGAVGVSKDELSEQQRQALAALAGQLEQALGARPARTPGGARSLLRGARFAAGALREALPSLAGTAHGAALEGVLIAAEELAERHSPKRLASCGVAPLFDEVDDLRHATGELLLAAGLKTPRLGGAPVEGGHYDLGRDGDGGGRGPAAAE